MRRIKKWLSLGLSLLLAVNLFCAPAMAAGGRLTAPTMTAEHATVTDNSVTWNVAASAEDPTAVVEYRKSLNGTVWNSWTENPEFKGLNPETTYYFQARYRAGNAETWMNSNSCQMVAISTAVYVKPVLPVLAAPKLASSIYLVKNSEIQLNEIPASSQDPDATKLYRISTDMENWSEWRTNKRFTGLKGSTTYYFQAMYRTSDPETWQDSVTSNIVSYTTLADGVNVSVRVIGTTTPNEKIDFSTEDIDYKGAVHQNWMQTTVFEQIPNGTLAYYFVVDKLTELGFEVKHSTSNGTSIKAPELFGGQTLSRKGYNDNKESGWVFNIYNPNGTLRYTGFTFEPCNASLRDGESIIVYYVFDKDKEVSGKRNRYADAWLEVTPDASLEDYELAYAAEDLINAIGKVTVGSGSVIDKARDAYDKLTTIQKLLVRNEDVLIQAEETYETARDGVRLTAPVLKTTSLSRTNTVTLVAGGPSTEDPDAKLQYRISEDGLRWNEWQDSSIFRKLQSSTKYYFQARYWPSDITKFGESEPSEILEITTTKAQEYNVGSRSEWLQRVAEAPTDGTEIILNITADVEVAVTGVFTTITPGGSNITMVGAGGSLISKAGGQNNNGICVGNGATLTLRDITYTSIGPWGIAFGKDQQTGNANFGSMIYLGGSDCTVNLDNVTMYGDCTQTGVVIGNGTSDIVYQNNTVNIYSGTLDQIGGGSEGDLTAYKRCMLLAANGCTVNLRPKGDILLEGVIAYDTVYVISNSNYEIKAASMLSGDFTSYTNLDSELAAMNNSSEVNPYKVKFSACGGLRLEVSDNPVAIPTKLKAPQVTADDFIVDKAHVVVPSDLVSTEQPEAVLQYRAYWYDDDGDKNYVLPYQKWMSRPMTFEIDLKEDTEYFFELRFNAIGGDYCNSDNTLVVLRTGFSSTTLKAPRLITATEKTINSIVLAEPKASTQDTTATLEYRMSTDGYAWGEWQEGSAFTDLQAATVYYFQARYKPGSYLWEASEESETLEVMTRYQILQAPTLTAEAAEKTDTSITLIAPASSEEDAQAIVEYRISEDGTNWNSEWQADPMFVGLKADTNYFFQARYSAENVGWLASESSAAVTIRTEVPSQKPTFALTSASGQPSETVQLELQMQNNPGTAMTKLTVSYDSSKLELVETQNGTVMDGCMPGPIGDSSWTVIGFSGSYRNTVENGTMQTLTFRIKESAMAGDTNVTISYAPEDVYDENGRDLEFAVSNGKVTIVSSAAAGDVNGDGTVNQQDVTVLTRYLAGWNETVYGAAADVNQDNTINVQDLIILRRHLAQWEGYEILPRGREA